MANALHTAAQACAAATTTGALAPGLDQNPDATRVAQVGVVIGVVSTRLVAAVRRWFDWHPQAITGAHATPRGHTAGSRSTLRGEWSC